MRKLTTEEFIRRSKIIYSDKYDYKYVSYNGKDIKVKLICREHNEIFHQTPNNHYKGKLGCAKCGSIKRSSVVYRLDTKEFIKRSKSIHKNKYDYSKTNYISSEIKVKIICPIHGFFMQKPHDHFKGRGCPYCCGRSYDTKSFVDIANKVHENKYDYSKVTYINAKTPIIIVCKKHGDFLQTPDSHIHGKGCQKCGFRRSVCEEIIKKYFDEKGISYEEQHKFDTCIGKSKKLIFDFYLQKYNLCIEYDGEQHYKDFKFYNTLKDQKQNDKIKTKWCKDNKVNLLRIPYWKKKNLIDIIKRHIDKLDSQCKL